MAAKIIKVLLFVGMLLSSSDAGVLAAAENKANFVRVAIFQEIEDLVLSVRGRYKIVNIKDGSILDHGNLMKPSRVIAREEGLYLGKNFFSTKAIRILPEKDVTLYWEGKGRRYRGMIEISVTKNNKFLVLNKLPLEKYIKGVLYHEVTDRWPMEAMKAQAVAARTYALYQMETNMKEPFDLYSNIYSQVYGGRSAEHYRTNIAVDRTKDEVLMFKGKVLPAYFHSNCGGHTEDVRNLWNHDLAPLAGVKCGYCVNAPGYSWKRNYQSSSIQQKLVAAGYDVGVIKDISVMRRYKSERVEELEIVSRSGKAMRITGKKFRDIIGPNFIRSNVYDVEMKGYFFDLIGRGWGHGVGMCQWGAYGMARQRYSYGEILHYYYPGAEIKKFSKVTGESK